MSTHILRCVYSKNRTCFLGINPLTWNRTVRNTSEFQVSIVRLTLDENRALYFSTFPDYTLKEGQFSLNGFFALKIGIEEDRFYQLIEQNELVPCESVTFCPVSIDDWQILEKNTEITEDVFLHQIRILSSEMIFPIWISGLCIFLRVVQIEPNTFAVIHSSTRVTVVPDYRPSTSTSTSTPGEIDQPSSPSMRMFLRSIGSFVCSSFNDHRATKNKDASRITKKCPLPLIPGRHRRVFRIDLQDHSHPTIVRLNRSDWSNDDEDGITWPEQILVRVTIFRGKDDYQRAKTSFFLLAQLNEDRLCRKNHALFSADFAQWNGIRRTDRCLISNCSRPASDSSQIELISSTWNGPALLIQHHFHQWIRSSSTVEQPMLLFDGMAMLMNEQQRYIVRLENNASYLAVNEETIGQYSIIVTEKKENNEQNDEGAAAPPPIDETWLTVPSHRFQSHHSERLFSLLETFFQSSSSSWIENFFPNVIITGRRASGKKTLVTQTLQPLCQRHLIYAKFLDCLTMKGRKLENILQSFTQILDDVIFRQPSILVLDHFDDLFVNENSITDANIVLATQKLALSVKELFTRVQKIHSQVVFIVIARDITNIHRHFTDEMPLFSSQIFTIEPLTQMERKSIIEDLLQQKHQTISPSLLQSIVNRSESFVIKDLQTLLDNALLHLWMSFEDRELAEKDFDYAFDEFKPIHVKLLDDDPKKSHRTITRWSDIGGMEMIKQELIQTVQWRFEHSNYFSHAPIRLVSGVLLYGPSGCGKTLLAQTLANECQVNFIQVKGPELLNKYVGSSEQNIRELFTRARSVTPCILLFDEFEALVPRRGRDSAGVTDRVVNQLLTELDGVESLGDIVVIAATSRPDLIDPALLRPGRLDKHFYIGFPSIDDVRSIWKLWTRKLRLADDVNFDDETLIQHCRWYTGADLKAFVYNAQLAAFEEYQSKDALIVHQRHFFAAIEQTAYSIPEMTRKSLEHFYSNWKKPIAMDEQRVSLA